MSLSAYRQICAEASLKDSPLFHFLGSRHETKSPDIFGKTSGLFYKNLGTFFSLPAVALKKARKRSRLHLLVLSQIIHLNVYRASIAYLLCVFRYFERSSSLDGFHIRAYLEEISTCIDLPLAVSLIEAGKIALFEDHLQSLALAWIQQLGLAESLEFLGWLLVSTLWSGDINPVSYTHLTLPTTPYV